MKVLVTGGGGFLGNEICRQLLARGDQVIAYQRSGNPALQAMGVEVIRGSLSETDLLNKAMENVDAVIHTAAKAGVWGPWEDYFEANVTGTENVLEACRRNNILHLVFTSSPSVIHDGADIEGADESLPYPDSFHSPYPATKAQAEKLVMAANCAELQTVSLRPHFIWGPGDNHLLPRLLARAKTGKLKLPGPDKLIDTVFVNNAANAHLLALDRLQTDPQTVGGKTYFISNDEPMTQGEVIGRMLKAAGVEVEIQPIPPFVAMSVGVACENIWKLLKLKSEPPLTRWSANHLSTAHWYDISAAKRELGYTVEISMDEGFEKLSMSCRNA